MSRHEIFETLLQARGLGTPAQRQAFLNPDYGSLADPRLLPDIDKAVRRIKEALKQKQKVVIYGDYDIDGLSATALLLEAFKAFGLDVASFVPSRFDEGYGLSSEAIEKLAGHGAQLIVTVDCGSLSFDEVAFAKSKGVDIIITDHHSIGSQLPEAVAVINPKREDHSYPFRDFAGVGVAFGLVRAVQMEFNKNPSTGSTGSRQASSGLPFGQEKWLLDLVALGTVCDIVPLSGENRTLAYWGIEVLRQTRRPGLRALMAVAGVEPATVSARSLGFGLGPRLNASGRLETAQLSLDLLTTTDNTEGLKLAQQLNVMNIERRAQQDKIFKAASAQAEKCSEDSVLVLSSPDWSHGIIGIVAAKLLEKYHKPTFVLQELGQETKGSARSFGDFSVGDALVEVKTRIIKGGGHKLAAGVTLSTDKIDDFRTSLNKYYRSLKLKSQADYFQPRADVEIESLEQLDEELIGLLAGLEPYGNDNPEPIFRLVGLRVMNLRKMGDKNQHVKLTLKDALNKQMDFVAFSVPEHFFVSEGGEVTVWVTLSVNEWRGNRSIEGKLLEVIAV